MMYNFNAAEVFKVAIRIEENGAKFYRRAAELQTDPKNKKFLIEPVQDSVPRILDVVMPVEAQALDLYQRAAGRQPDKEGRVFLEQLVDEEKSHLVQIGRLLEQFS